MRSLGVSHIGFGVRDLERSTTFYRDVLGLKIVLELSYDEAPELLRRPEHRSRKAVYFRLSDAPAAPVITMGSIDPEDQTGSIMLDQRGIHHLAIWVDDLAALLERLRAAGTEIFWGPFYIPKYVVDVCDADRAPADVVSMFFRDPDGICIQAEQRTEGNPHSYPVAGLEQE